MDRAGFVKLAAIGFALVVASFVVRGVARLVVGRELAELLQAPLIFAGFALLVYLFVRATLDAVGIWPVEDPDA
ncbi:hypothetical protein [Halopiger xanaduensis]|uniref:Uncharacterized protein n=1 Tax=Halopiger xanaduensis (strain DSM 18323 / JCM 14033 / SH-6) TaxID=797210 RepID=F8D8U1_HALXS|nr:hypothetical protein [Halopiger xanaduensis]AEH38001.1 hypothetical protein Halxa_3389 [Halopiger xanaduensis SH-6]